MPSETYSFLDVAVLDEVRERFAAGDALAILSLDLEQVIWANGPGALLFDYHDVEAIIGADARLGASARRQVMATRGFPAIGRDRPILVRMASGVSSRIEAFLASAVTLPDGEAAILLAVPAAATGAPDAAAIAARAISGFTEAGHFVAMVDVDGTIAAASPGFAALGLSTETLAGMTDRLARGPGRIAKRMLPGSHGSLPAGMVRLTEDPARHLLVVIDEGRSAEEPVAAAHQPVAARPEPVPEFADEPLDEVAADVAESIVLEPVDDVAASLSAQTDDSWHVSAGSAAAEPATVDTAVHEPVAASAQAEVAAPAEPEPVSAEQIAIEEAEAPEAPAHAPVDVPAPAAIEPRGEQADAEAAPGQPAAHPDTPRAEPAAGAVHPARVNTAVRFVWRTDAEGRFSQVSPEFAAAVGEAAADVIGRRFEDVANAFGLDPAGEIAGLLARRDTWSGRSVLWPVAGTELRIPVDLAALPVYNRLRVFEGFRGFGVARAGDAVADPERLGLVLVPGPFTPPEQAAPPVAPTQQAPVEEPQDADPFRGEVPALEITPAPDRRSTDKVIRLAEHRPSPADKGGLSSVERLAFQQIGERLKKDSDARAGRPAKIDEPVGKVLDLPERRPEQGPGEPASPVAEVVPDVADAVTVIERRATPGDVSSAPASIGLLHEDIVAEPAKPSANEAEPSATITVIEEAPRAPAVVDEPVIVAASAEAAAPAAEPAPIERARLEGDTAPPATAVSPATETEAVPANTLQPKSEEAAPTTHTPEPAPPRKGPRPGMSLLDFAQWDDGEDVAAPAGQSPAIAIEAGEPTEAETLAATQAPVVGAEAAGADVAVESIEPKQAEAAPEPGIAIESAGAEAATDTPPADQDRDMPSTVVALRPHPSPEIAPIAEPPVPAAEAAAPSNTGQALYPQAARALPVEGERRKLTDTAILEKLPVPVLVHSGDLLHYANDEFFRLTGYTSISDLAEAGGIGVLFAESYDDDEHGGRRDRQLRVRARSGEEFPVEAFLQSVPWNGGKALLLVLSRAKEGEPAGKSPLVAELESRVAEMRTIIDTATDGVVLIARDGSIRSISRPAEALFGFDSDEVTGKPFASLFAMESQRAARDYLEGLSHNTVASVLNDGREVIGREAQGRFIPLFMTIGSLPGDSGFCAVVRDITQWKRAEEELTQARAVAERASSHKTDFLARVSHEIRTPLNAIIGFSELMLDERFGPIANDRYRDYLRDINRSGNHVLDLVNDLLDISKIEAGQQEMASEAVSLNDTLAETVAMMQPQANRERVIIRSSFASKLPDVVADLRSVRQIALNILSNAVRYTQAGGQVIVSTAYETGGDIVMRVRDTGIGMTQAEIEQALKPFKQINSLRRARGDGTGLGLPLTKAMVEANRARFSITSTPGEGTLVEVVFPSARVLAG